jgi:hypothetical protein
MGRHVVVDSVDAFCLETGPSKQLLKGYSFIVELLWDVGYVAGMLLHPGLCSDETKNICAA